MENNDDYSEYFEEDNDNLELEPFEPNNTCDICGSVNKIIVADGEIICKVCGNVLRGINERLSTEPEWRVFSPEERSSRERVGSPTSPAIHDQGLSTVVGNVSSGASQKERETAYKLKKWNRRTRVHSSKDRNLVQAMSELNKLAEKNAIPNNVKNEAAIIYRKVLDKDLVRGRSISAIIAASLYAACRQYRVQRTLTNISKFSSISKKEIARCYRLILKELDMKMPIPDPSNKIPAIASAIGASSQAQELARAILTGAKEMGITAGKDPTGIAAAALYISCSKLGEHKTQRVIAKAANVTEVTIRNRYKGLMPVFERVEQYRREREEDPSEG